MDDQGAPPSNGDGPVPSTDGAGETVAAMASADTISADEIALYDRQIRLWGMQAQEKIRTANILILSMNALGNEVAKNLVLAGISTLTIVDDAIVKPEHLGAQFLLSEADVGKNRAEAVVPALQALNPRVSITAFCQSPLTLTPDFFALYNITIANDLPYPALIELNIRARFVNRPFYAAGLHGLYGYLFADLISHDYIIERERSNVPLEPGKAESATRSIVSVTPKPSTGSGSGNSARPIELITKREIYSPLQLANTSPLPPPVTSNRRRLRAVPPLLTCIRALWEFESSSPTVSPPQNSSRTDIALFTKLAGDKHKELLLPLETLRSEFLRSFLQNMGAELAPVAAWLGGQLAQECVNVLSGREQPVQNFALFDGDEMRGQVYALHPVFDAALDGALGDAGGPVAMPVGGLAPTLGEQAALTLE